MIRNTTLLCIFSILFLLQAYGQEIINPNVIIFYTDDLGWQDTELNNEGAAALAETPNILTLAAAGANFSQGYSPAPTCAPSRTAMMSGHHTTQTKMTHVGGGQIPEANSNNSTNKMIHPFYPGRLNLEEISIAEALTPNGYVTGAVGKWHMAVKNNAFPAAIDQGFDYEFTDRGMHSGMADRSTGYATDDVDDPFRIDADGRPFDSVTESALDFLENENNKAVPKPFFLYMATWLVHAPIQSRDLALLTYYSDKLGIPVPTTEADITTGGQTNPYFGAMVATADWSLGKIVDYLETTDDNRNSGKKLIETTYIIFSSDNGAVENVGQDLVTDNFPLDEGKKHLQEGGVRTPFVIAGPGIAAGGDFANVVSHLDFFPTILSLTGTTVDASISDKFDGVDLSPFLKGESSIVADANGNERTDLYWHFPHGPDNTMQSSLRSDEYKLYNNHLDDSYELYQLYNSDGSNNDIEEAINIIDVVPVATKDALIAKLDVFLAINNSKYPQWNADYSGGDAPLLNQNLVPSVVSTNFDQNALTATATVTEDAGQAEITSAYLIYRISEVDTEEWFLSEVTPTINGNVITADVPADATSAILNLIDENNFLVLTDNISTVPVTIDGTYNNAVDTGDGTWATATNWTNSTIANATGIATLQRTIDLETNNYSVGQLQISGNTNTKTFSNGTITLNGTLGTNPDQIIRNRSNKPITITCNVTVNVDDRVLHIRNNAFTQLIFNTGTFALGANTINVDNLSTAGIPIPVEFNGSVTGSGSINITSQSISLGTSSDFSGFTGRITFGGTNGLLTVNGVNTIEGSIGVLAASDGNSIVEFKTSQNGLANLTVDTQALALDFDAAATEVIFSGYTNSTTEGVVDLQNYVPGTLKIGINATGVSQTILDTWLIDGIEPADGTLVQDASGFITISTTYTSVNGFVGPNPNDQLGINWEDGSSWVGGIAPTDPSDNVIIHGLITINSDVTVNDITVENADNSSDLKERIIVNAGHSLTVEGDAVTRGQIFATSNSNSYSSLIFVGDVDGEIRFNRYVNGVADGNDLVASPVTVPFSTFSGQSPNLFENPSATTQKLFGPFDNTSGIYLNWDTLTDAAENLIPGKGYRAATDGGGTIQFREEPVSPAVDVPVTLTDGGDLTYGLWNLIGNPFPSYLDFGAFWTENSGALNGGSGVYQAIYGYDADDSDGSNYTIWNGFNTTDKITPAQGFFVRTISGGTITFKPAMRTVGSTDDFIIGRPSTTSFVLSELFLSNESSNYNTKIYFSEDKTRGLDPGYDAADFAGSVSRIYTNLVEDNEGVEFAIQALPYNDFNDVVVPLGVNSDAGIQLTISLNATSTPIPSSVNVYLEDNVTNTWTLLNTDDYVFTPSAELSGTGRFFVHFSSEVLSTEITLLNGLQIYSIQDSKTIVVRGQLVNDTNAIIYDIHGRLILQQELDSSNTTNTINVNALNTGIYIFQLESDSQSKTQKIILN